MKTNTGDTYDPFDYQKGNKTNTGSSSSSSSGSSSGGYYGGRGQTNTGSASSSSSGSSSGAYYGGKTGLNTNSGRGGRKDDETSQTAKLLITLDKGVSAYKNHGSSPEHTFSGTDSVSIDFKIKDDYLKVSKGTHITAYNQNNFAIQLLFIEPGKNGRENIYTYLSIPVDGQKKGIWFPEAAQLRVIKE